jgi:hypothetical protein
VAKKLSGQLSLPQPKRKIGSPGPDHLETKGRDGALDRLEELRSGLVEVAREVAIQLAKRRNRITSVEVFAALRAQGYDESLDAADPRWMGVVFREDIWQREGWETTGSHRRPVAIWSLRDPHNVPLSPREKVYRAVSGAKGNGLTVEEIVVSTDLSGAQVRTALDDLATLNRVSATAIKRRGKTRRKTTVYMLPEHDPDLL